MHRKPPTARLVLLKELSTFGGVGAAGLIVEISLFNLLFSDGQVIAKCVSTLVATLVTYLGNRYLSFAHRTHSGVARQGATFLMINLGILAASVIVLAAFEYPLHFKRHLIVMNIVNLATIGIGTILRFHCYKRFVFRTPRPSRDLEPAFVRQGVVGSRSSEDADARFAEFQNR